MFAQSLRWLALSLDPSSQCWRRGKEFCGVIAACARVHTAVTTGGRPDDMALNPDIDIP
jgi:hypothetical protein